MSEWWRWDGWPEAGEWQAWWGFVGSALAGLLLLVAWKQLSGLAESNRQLSVSNKLLTASNLALSRPAVMVEYLFERHANRDFSSSQNDASVYVVISNIGASPARNVVLHGTPEFQAATKKVALQSTEFLNKLFSGEMPIKMLAPGQKLKYVLDEAREALQSETLPAEYVINATYTDLEQSQEFSDEFVLQMAPWGMTIAEVPPMKRISKDIQFISENLRNEKRGLPSIAGSVKGLRPDAEERGRRMITRRPSIPGRSFRRSRT